MRVLVVYAHPLETSFNAALHTRVLTSLRRKGHDVDDCDLYAESFDHLLSRQDFLDYTNPCANRRRVAPYVDRLLAANAMVLVYPVWNEGFPAILKGFLDRVFLPGVSFEMGFDGSCRAGLRNIDKLGAVCTYGCNRLTTMLMGDPPRRVVTRLLRAMTGRPIRCDYLAHYDMNHTTPERRAGFQEKVTRVFESW
jgi:NAD(P)H dehydrogenase (quinone)